DVSPGMTVLDACSAPGGKTTHIAEKMADQGIIHAYDIHEKKTKLVQEKAKQLQLSIIYAEQADARALNAIPKKEASDHIVVEAQCKGFGVMRAKTDIKYRKKEKDMHQ